MRIRYGIFIFLLILCSIFTLIMGATPISQVWHGVINRLFFNTSEWNPLLDERLPRLIVLLCSGSALAVSGAVMQSLFQNPLASPSILGISCGGSLLVLLVFISEIHISLPFAIPLAATLGCQLTLLLVYGLTRSKGQVHVTTLLLTGIALSTLLFALQGSILYAFRDHWPLIQIMTEWEAGSTLDRNWNHVHMQLPLTLIGIWGCWKYRKELDILALGDEEALNLGVEVSKVRWRLFLCVALLTGGAIAAIGIIGFFGLVLPHVLRKIYGPNNFTLIPLCILAGSISLCGLDLILRFFSIYAFSIGNISAVLGGIFFLILLLDAKYEPLGTKI